VPNYDKAMDYILLGHKTTEERISLVLLEQGGGRLQAGDSDHRDHRDRLPPPYIDHMDDSASSSTSEFLSEFFPAYLRSCAS
jgi:hypothetical protein